MRSLFLIGVIFLVSGQGTESCPEGFDLISNHCFLRLQSLTKVPWFEAIHYCERQGAQLAILKDTALYNEIITHLNGSRRKILVNFDLLMM